MEKSGVNGAPIPVHIILHNFYRYQRRTWGDTGCSIGWSYLHPIDNPAFSEHVIYYEWRMSIKDLH